jgi:photosystem II stability/assembly factor-like uncharacterized protein
MFRTIRVSPTVVAVAAALITALVAGLVYLGNDSSPAPLERLERVEIPPRGPDDWIVAQRAGDTGAIPANAYENAVEDATAIAADTRASAPALSKARWKLEGPRDTGGRVVDIAVDPNELNTVYAAVATAGVWKSTDAGLNFTRAWPKKATPSMGALAIASDGTLYAGTGEANPGGGSIVYGGNGVYKSTDGGKKWTNVGLKGAGAIGRIMVDPNNPKKIFVAAAGPLFTKGGTRGLYVSTDAGKSWKRVLKGSNSTTGAVDLAIDPTDSKTIYVSMWDHIRHPDLRVYGGVGSGLYRSTDGGKTFKRLGAQQGLPGPGKEVGRIGVAVAPLNPDLVYAIYITTRGPYMEFYRSTDGGSSFSPSPGDAIMPTAQATYGWWFGRIWVDPVNPLHVYAGGLFLAESFDGGLSFAAQAANIHPDHHAMAWDPQVPGRVYLGNDGGFYMSPTNGSPESNWVPSLHMPWTQFYSVAASAQDATRVAGGAQDNGSLRSWGLPNDDPFGCASWINCGDWNNYYGGDGVQNLINPKDQNNVFACYQYGECARSTNGGDSMTAFTGQTVSLRRNWFSPLEFDPSDPKVMYYGGNQVNRSTDNGQTWSVISKDLTGGPGRDTDYPYGTTTTIDIAKKDPELLMVGTDDGRVWKTKGSVKRFVRLKDDDLPKLWVTRVAIHPRNKRKMYVSFSGYRNNNDNPRLAYSKNGGRTFRNISRRLPDAPVNDIVLRGRKTYVATDVGVFLSKNNGRRWLRVGRRLPFAPVNDIDLIKKRKQLYAATYGRGAYSIKLPKGF